MEIEIWVGIQPFLAREESLCNRIIHGLGRGEVTGHRQVMGSCEMGLGVNRWLGPENRFTLEVNKKCALKLSLAIVTQHSSAVQKRSVNIDLFRGAIQFARCVKVFVGHAKRLESL